MRRLRRRTRPAAGPADTAVTEVVEEGATPPVGPPVPPDRDLWPWLLALLLLVLVGLAAAYFISRDDEKQAAPTTTVVSTVAGTTTVSATTTTPVPATTTATALTTTHRRPATAPPRVTVANVLGIRAATAVTRVKEDGLQPRVEGVYSEKPRGIVAAQKPRPGVQVAKGSAVVLSVSKGGPPAPVPDVVGQSSTEAVRLLRAAGFGTKGVLVPSDEPRSNVIAQNPRAGQKAPKGTIIRLNVSDGSPTTTATTTATTTGATATQPRATTTTPSSTAPTTATAPTTTASAPTRATVPDVVGKTLRQARLAIRKAGLVTEVKYVPNTQPEGTVVAQSPKPAAPAKRGGHVLVNVSLGPKPSPQQTVPDVIGQDEATATTQIQRAGFTVVAEDYPTTDPAQDGKVIDEQPAAGSKAPRGSEITIYVGRAG
jgi:beta-lactam-binding protein with PASTA domain